MTETATAPESGVREESAVMRSARRNRKFQWGNIPYTLALFGWAAVTVLIFIWVILNSLKDNTEIFGSPWSLPANPIAAGIDNYVTAWNISNMGGYFANSVLVAVAAVAVTVAISAPAAYALARIPFLGSRPLTYFFIAGMGLPFQLVLVPLYVLFVDLGLVNTRLGLVVVFTAVSIPFTILLLSGFFRTLPTELEEAAALDGCSEFGIFFRIMMRVATPGLFTAAIFNFVFIWQEYLLTALLISSDENRTLPVGLLSMRQSLQYTGDWASMFAGTVIVVVPSFIVFVLLSNRIMSGMTMGSGK